jgi:hypothetical protein
VVYAASSSTYGDHPGLPKVEDAIGRPMSPYALTKLVDELYAEVFARTYGTRSVGLRYFNVFGPRQDPQGAYAAVIPAWTAALLRGEPVWVNGDGETSRDFCYVANVVQANLLAATPDDPAAINEVYNIALGDRTTLNELFEAIRDALVPHQPALAGRRPQYRDFRTGDVRHSQADITKARTRLGFAPTHRVAAARRLDEVDQGLHRPVRLDRMAHGALAGDFVFVLSARPVPDQVAPLLEVGDDALDGTLGDSDALGDVAEAQLRVPGEAQKYMGMVGEERPPDGLARRRHGPSIDIEIMFCIARIS